MRLTLADVLRSAARRWPQRLAVQITGEPALTYAELLDQANRFAAALEQHYPRARHVALLLPNSTPWVVALYGTALAGRTAVLLNPRLRDAELVYQIGQSDSEVLVVGDAPRRGFDTLFPALADEGIAAGVVRVGGTGPAGATSWSQWLATTAPEPGPDRSREDGTAVIIYTSGTTALPKGVMLAHSSVVRNAQVVGARFGADETDRVFSAGPFFHSGGLTMHVVLSALYGCAAYSVPAFEPDTVLDVIEREHITIYNGIETLFLRLADGRYFAPERLRSIRTGWATGTPAILRAIADDIGVAGVIGVYGISEASPNVTMSTWDDSREHRLGTIGSPQPDTEVTVREPGTDEPCPPGSPGELLVRGYGVMQGYYNKPAETAEALRGGWLHTGDLVIRREDGYLEFAGRIKDIVRIGGENVSCVEVENAIYALGDVELAAVLPVEDSQRGEIAVAAVKPAQGASAFSEDLLQSRLREHLAGYKVPQRAVRVESMPLTESGKVQKARLREQIERLIEQQV